MYNVHHGKNKNVKKIYIVKKIKIRSIAGKSP